MTNDMVYTYIINNRRSAAMLRLYAGLLIKSFCLLLLSSMEWHCITDCNRDILHIVIVVKAWLKKLKLGLSLSFVIYTLIMRVITTIVVYRLPI